jgi:membrane associated rhomboid family serine protease
MNLSRSELTQRASNVTEQVDKAVDKAANALEKDIEDLPARLGNAIRPYSARAAAVVEAVHIDSPYTTLFAVICVVVHVVNVALPGKFSQTYFAVWPWRAFSFTSPLSYWRLISHIFGHGSWSHLSGNMTNLLLVCPAVERHWGGKQLAAIFLYVAIASGIAHMLLGPSNSAQLGASGVVFSTILLNSLIEMGSAGTNGFKGRVPLTFIAQIFLWVNKEVISTLFASGTGVSHLAHLVGAVVGTVAGYHLS